ncbi:TIGR02281 family clan AA aspartic protease [Pseudanabaena sp. PCC 6802]|uniref:retropepsin-like aspartic protease family protein n=1 Tax=Pseudanabaena sp. PCC 6802 TaxID=118173 RepID=UPI000370B3E7|nr:retropepsin-like aspartic protease [Pseudanabaena sp. PCC 6802]
MTRRFYALQRYGNLFWLKAVVMGESRDPRVVRLLVDTGSSYTVMPPKVLMEIGCDVSAPNRRVAIMAAGGMMQPPVVNVPFFNCLGQQVENFSVLALNLPFNPLVNGLLGMDFLKHCGATIQIRESKIILE